MSFFLLLLFTTIWAGFGFRFRYLLEVVVRLGEMREKLVGLAVGRIW